MERSLSPTARSLPSAPLAGALLAVPALALGAGGIVRDGADPAASQPGGSTEPGEARALWADLDGDGRLDVYSLAPGREDVFLANRGPAGFADATAEAGLAGNASRQAIAADLEGDGAPELLLVRRDGTLALLRREGSTFGDSTRLAGLDGVRGARSLALVDCDGDGRLDVWVETASGPALLRARRGGTYEAAALALDRARDEAPAPPGAAARPAPGHAVSGTDEGPASGAPSPSDGAPSRGRRPGTGGTSESGGTSPGSSSTPTPFGPVRNAAAAACVEALTDAAGGGCLGASSEPMLGMLYPLTSDLFVDPFGRVGIGTTSPDEALHVAGNHLVTGDLHAEDDMFLADSLVLGSSGTILTGAPGVSSTFVGNLQLLDDFVVNGTGSFGVRLGVGTSAPQEQLHVRTTFDADLLLEADSDNSNENDHPALRMSQDGGFVQSQIGIGLEATGNDLVVQNLYEFSDVNLRVVDGRAFEFENTNTSGSPVDVEARLTTGGDWQIDGSVSSPAADLAEYYPVTGTVEPGDVVAFTAGGGSLVCASGADGARLAGVVSSRPAFVMGLSYTVDQETRRPRAVAEADRPFAERPRRDADPAVLHEIATNGRAPLALAGRVPCKVSAENGRIRPGDLLALSTTRPGHAARAVEAGPVVGTALEGWSSGAGRILVFVNPGWFSPDVGEELADLRRDVEELRHAVAALAPRSDGR